MRPQVESREEEEEDDLRARVGAGPWVGRASFGASIGVWESPGRRRAAIKQMPRRSLKVKETEVPEERIALLWNQRRRWRRDVAGQRRDNGSENQRWVHNGRVRRLICCGGWRRTGDPGRLIGNVVEGEEGVSSESEVASCRAELFEKATTVFDPGRSSKTRFDNGESKLI